MTSQIAVFHQVYSYQFPSVQEPQWSHQVERWYQLDAYAYGLAQAYSELRAQFSQPPHFVFLASPEGSNRTDSQFVRAQAASPSKFVHTLPNIRGSSLCQVMQWNGPILCVQQDPSTQIAALREAADLLSPSVHRIWIFGVILTQSPEKSQAPRLYQVHWFELETAQNLDPKRKLQPSFKILRTSQQNELMNTELPQSDVYLIEWMNHLSSPKSRFRLSDRHEIHKWTNEDMP
jgi:hypothetical protein